MMNIETKKLWKEAGKNSFIACCIFAVVILFLFLMKLHESINPIAIVSGLLGVAYVLTVKNPANYIGFVMGVLSSIALGIQFYMGNMIDWTVLYFFIFIPCQIYTFYVWVKGSKTKNDKPFLPSYLSVKNSILMAVITLALIVCDLLVANAIRGNELTISNILPTDSKDLWKAIMGATGVATSILANFLLIRKKTDAWVYWVIFSIASTILQILLKDYVTLTLFSVYTIINANALIAWIKCTPKRNSKM